MELENIVANTVLLKAREGKWTREAELGLTRNFAGLSCVVLWEEKVVVGNGGSALLSTTGNPAATQSHTPVDATVERVVVSPICVAPMRTSTPREGGVMRRSDPTRSLFILPVTDRPCRFFPL